MSDARAKKLMEAMVKISDQCEVIASKFVADEDPYEWPEETEAQKDLKDAVTGALEYLEYGQLAEAICALNLVVEPVVE